METNPEITNLEITLQDGTVLTGKTPFSYEVPGGDIELRFQKKGYNTTTRELNLDQPRQLKVWMDPEGLLYESVIRYKCGPNPKQVAFTPDGQEMWVSLLGGYGLEIFEPDHGQEDRRGEARRARRRGSDLHQGRQDGLRQPDGDGLRLRDRPGHPPGEAHLQHRGKLDQGAPPLPRREDHLGLQLGEQRRL